MRLLHFTGSTLSAAVLTPIRGLHTLRGGRWHEGRFVSGDMTLLRSGIISLVCLTAAIVSPTPALAQPSIVVSVPDQTLALINDGVVVARYRVSTSKFGLGDGNGTYATPLGAMAVASKIGANAPLGAVFKNRQRTGEVLKPNAPGRDPIVSRILWLRGLEKQNARAYSRNIYIHGTPEERLIGRPASYGCIRMRSQDIAQLFNAVPVGTKIEIANAGLGSAVAKAKLESQTRTTRLAAN
jgi:lipoprotein-anchoring transpeptidase ErfK/SrfK